MQDMREASDISQKHPCSPPATKTLPQKPNAFVVLRVLSFTFFKNGCDVSSFSGHWGLCLAAMIFQI